MHIDELFRTAVKKGASDIHFVSGQPPILRIDGLLSPIPGSKVLTPSAIEDLAFDIISQKQKEQFIEDRELDISYEIANLSRFRVNLHFERGHVGLVARVIPNEIPSMQDLMIPNIVHELVKRDSGLILVTGPTGSGKSTTLASIIEFINQERASHVVILEDPIEFIFTSKKSLIIQRQLHTDMLTFEEALSHVLRQDPNIIVVGEMRNLETISAAITLAETGHLVLATLHTHNTSQTIDRIIDIFPSNQQEQVRLQLATSLSGIVSQKLIPGIKSGRVAAREVLINVPAIANLIRENKITQIKTVIQTNAENGMFSMDQNIQALYKAGFISNETAKNHVTDSGMIK